NHIISFRMEVPADKFLNVSNSLLKSSLELLHEVVYNPLLKDRAFKSSIVEQEKRFLKQRINSLYNEKMLYANGRLVEEMFKGEPYEFPAVREKKISLHLMPHLFIKYMNNYCKTLALIYSLLDPLMRIRLD